MSLPSTVVSTSSSSSSFAVAQSADTLLVRDVDGQYRVASSEEVLLQAWGVLAARVKPGAAMTSPQAVKDYLRLHGRLCLQFGYSDSGRYVGQLAASYLVERLRLRLAELLRRILLQVDAGHVDPDPVLFDDAAWVGWRLAELLPLSMPQRQALLQFDDPHQRLQILLDGIADVD